MFADAGIEFPGPGLADGGAGNRGGAVELVPVDPRDVGALVVTDRAARTGREGKPLGGQPALTTH